MERWFWLSYRENPSYNNILQILRFSSKVKITGIFVDTNNKNLLKTIIPLAKKYDIKIHGWVWVLNANNDKFVQENHPEWFSKNKSGESSLTKPAYVDYYKWLCPSNENVREYLRNKILKLLKNYELDGIHLDYIRYPDVILPKSLQPKYNLVQDREMPEFDYCYCKTCRENFKNISGIDPLNIDENDFQNILKWNKYRYDQLTFLVNTIAKDVKSLNKKISAAVFPTVKISKKNVRQDWSKWNIHRFFPMIYHQFYGKDENWFEEVIKENLEQIPKFKFFPGIYVKDIKKREFARILKIIKKYKLPGVSIFDYNSMPTLMWDNLLYKDEL